MNSVDASDQVYLASDTKLEPLVFRWYAWGHLISPVQLALNLAFRHLPMLKSFVANPSVHEAASKNPKMIGGSFVELKQCDVPAVRTLLQNITQHGARLLDFANDLIKLDRHLHKSEVGFSLDHLYETLPSSLAGLVEATYDLNNHPSLRILEELIYREDDLDRIAPQEIAFCKTRDDARSFFINTPRLDGEDRLVLPLQFDSEIYNLISASRISPVAFRALADLLGVVDEVTRNRLRSYFTATPSPRNEPAYHGENIRVRYFGHACVLIQSADVSILVDPFLTWDQDAEEDRLTFHDLPDRLNYVFLTHNHQDHFSIEALLQLRCRIDTILVPRNNAHSLADPSMKLALQRIGHVNVQVMDPMECITIPNGKLVSLPFYGEHADLSINSKHGLCVELNGRKVLLLADSDCKDRMLYRRIAKQIGHVDYVFIGMECNGAPLSWLYGPYLSHSIARKDDESRRLSGSDCERAWSIVEEFGCKSVYVYAMGQEPWLRFVAGLEYTPQSKQILESEKFIARCHTAGIYAERLNGCRTFTLE